MTDEEKNLLKYDLIVKTLLISDEEILADVQSALQGKANSYLGNRLLSVLEAQEYLGGVSRTTIWKYRNNGLGSVVIGGRCFFKIKHLEEFIDRCQNDTQQHE